MMSLRMTSDFGDWCTPGSDKSSVGGLDPVGEWDGKPLNIRIMPCIGGRNSMIDNDSSLGCG